MSRRKWSVMAFAAAILVSSFSGTAHATMVLHRGNGAEPKSLDPHFTEGTWESAVISDMIVGLTTDDAEGKPIPGAAESWTVSEDGRTWTFHLRDHVWSDDTPVTAKDFVFAWRRILDPASAAKYASILYLFKNAKPINGGELPPDALGAFAPDDRTLVLELEHPAPYLAELMTHHTTYPLPSHVVERLKGDWSKPGNYVANGPYVPVTWIPNGHIKLIKNPKFYAADTVRIDEVYFYPTEDSQAALKRFRAFELDTQDPLPAARIDWLKEHMAENLRIVPYLGVSYIVVNQERQPFDDVRVREALNLAFDRDTIADKIMKLGEPPAYGIVPPKVANYPGGVAFTWKDMAYPERVKRAQALMQEAGFGPENRLRTTFATSTSPDNKRVAAAVQQMWRQIYVDIEIVQTEVQINYTKLQEGDFDIGQAAWVGDFNDPINFLFLLESDNGGLNYGRYKNPEYDALLDKAEQEKDAAKRGEILAAAERMALEDYAWIPNRFLVTRNLVQTYVGGWVSNIKDVNRTRWLWIDKRPARIAETQFCSDPDNWGGVVDTFWSFFGMGCEQLRQARAEEESTTQ